MKIGVDISQAQYVGTGVGTYTHNLVQQLLQSNPEDLVLFGSSLRNFNLLNKLFISSNPNSKIWPLPPNLMERLINNTNLFNVESLVGKVDIFHASDWTQPSSKTAQLVTTIHDLTVLKFPQYQHPKIITVHQKRLERISRFGVHVIADSVATKIDILRLMKLPESQVSVIYLAVGNEYRDLNNLSRVERSLKITQVRQKYQLQTDYILSVGTQEPRKNLLRVLDAFGQLNTQYPQLTLALVGKYGWGDNLDQKLPARVKSLGFVDHADLPALYAGAKAFVYPSLYEGFGLPVLEAMTMGTPVVTSNRGSLKEVAGNAALAVNPTSVEQIARGLNEVLSFPKEFVQKGLSQAKLFSWEKTASETLAVYEKLLR